MVWTTLDLCLIAGFSSLVAFLAGGISVIEAGNRVAKRKCNEAVKAGTLVHEGQSYLLVASNKPQYQRNPIAVEAERQLSAETKNAPRTP